MKRHRLCALSGAFHLLLQCRKTDYFIQKAYRIGCLMACLLVRLYLQ